MDSNELNFVHLAEQAKEMMAEMAHFVNRFYDTLSDEISKEHREQITMMFADRLFDQCLVPQMPVIRFAGFDEDE